MIAREGSIITFEIRANDVVNEYTFDIKKGGNTVAYYSIDPEVEVIKELSFVERNRIFVPDHISHRIIHLPREGGKAYSRSVTFTKNVVNQEIDPVEFTLERLGIRPGDSVIDNVVGTEYIYQPENVVAQNES